MTCTLTPINLTNPSEHEELLQQRIACGWDNTPEKIATWRKKQDAGLKSFFWITAPSRDVPLDGATEQTLARVGHISLDAYADPVDWDVANDEKTNLVIQTFFILPKYRSGGIGGATMAMIEGMATKTPYGSPNCEYITLSALSKKHYYDEVSGPYVRTVMPICNQEWYEKRGYIVWKEEPKYEDTLPDNMKVVFDAVYMRKKVN
ncbi:hypothetical protein BDW59DRAFT_53164 [Aspergillus cavernicola]|uniref:N-acetyltransferase domain-containing protein n=1 Tax=Aspergillus cavernicola TaxID=176166 RepID=A0ABR4IJK5_9EURO